MARERRAWRQLLGVLALAAATGAGVAALALCDPAVEASIQTEVPSTYGPAVLTGSVASLPVYAQFGTLSLSWIPHGGRWSAPRGGESILVEIDVSQHDCVRLSQIAGSCGASRGPGLRDLELLRIEALGGPLYGTAKSSTAPRLELQQHGDPTHRGAPLAWTLTENAPRARIELSCQIPVAFSLTATPRRRGGRLPSKSATCQPAGVTYRLGVIDTAPVATTTTFGRLREFEARASAKRGRMEVDRAMIVVDGDPAELSNEEPTPIALHPDGQTRVSLLARSPATDRPAEVRISAAEAAEVLVSGNDRTPSEFERLPDWATTDLLIAWSLLLAGAFAQSITTLAKGRWRSNAEAK